MSDVRNMFRDELNQHVPPVWPTPMFITLGLENISHSLVVADLQDERKPHVIVGWDGYISSPILSMVNLTLDKHAKSGWRGGGPRRKIGLMVF